MNRNRFEKILAVAAAVLLWQLAAVAIGEEVLLVSPLKVVLRLSELIFEAEFWGTILFSFKRITLGFFIALAAGTALAILSYRFRIVEIFLWPYISIIKATPVASFVILCLIWLSSSQLPIFIAFLMAVPIIYTNMLGGLKAPTESCWKWQKSSVFPLAKGCFTSIFHRLKAILSRPAVFLWA